MPQRANKSVVNVASVPQRSPFRYPGGKTWFVPYLRCWMKSLPRRPRRFVEPFAGGGIVGLTVAAEGLAERVILGELDAAVAAVWRVMLSDDAEWLCARIADFRMSRANVEAELSKPPAELRELAFQTILRNRTQRGGILAPGAALVRQGEQGKGVGSRWYPDTLIRRIGDIHAMRDRLEFHQCDAFELLAKHRHQTTCAFFVDPPYTAGGKRAGSRLYRHSQISHRSLFAMMSKVRGPVLMTYDDAPEVRQLTAQFDFQLETVPMKNTHHAVMHELAISNLGSCLRQARQVADFLKTELVGISRGGISNGATLPLFAATRR